ncbi:cytochrome P450 [Panaeolus papilionaceus]|nr:cytochrome P450 [Panaeolus papilionaceus]
MAQAELDSVLGPYHLPDFSDRASLPYINAMVKESMRWHTVASLGIPHMSSRDDEYAGYFIPKGTIVMGNTWRSRVPLRLYIFKSPSEYIPERYLKDGQINPDVRDASEAAFGAGRRKCPGKYLSDESLYIIIASTLSLFDIEAALDDSGRPVKPPASFSSGLISYPTPFKCCIIPRSPTRARLLYDSMDT